MLEKFSEYGRRAGASAKERGYDETQQSWAAVLGGLMAELAACPECDSLMAVNDDYTVGYCKSCDTWFHRKEEQ